MTTDRHASWFKFFPADFMNGVRGLTPQEVGLYTMLLCRIYEESGPVEYNVLRLSTYCGMRETSFTKTAEKLVALGKLVIQDGMLSNARAEIEISNRSNDLKSASRAGKISAQKRQQNQSQTPTDVERPFNHTDTDTDTHLGGGGSACAHEADIEADPGAPTGTAPLPDGQTARETVLAAMGLDTSGIVGGGKFVGGQSDMAELDRWLALPGLTLPVIAQEIRGICAGKTDGPPASFKYFTKAMTRLAGALSAPALQPDANAPAAPTTFARPDPVAASMARLQSQGRI